MNHDDVRRELDARMKELAVVRSTAGVLGWDEQTHLPPAGTAWRAEQSAYLQRLAHDKSTDARFGELIEYQVQHAPSGSAEAAEARELKRSFERAKKLPGALVEELARLEVLSQSAWVEARKKSAWLDFAPWLERMIELKRRVADCYGYEKHPYDALIEDYEPGATLASLKPVFEALREPLAKLVQKAADSGRRPPQLAGPFPIDRQEAFGTLAAKTIGFDFNAGRLDVSVHPFCTGLSAGDTRITTRYRLDDLSDALFGVLHEVGHALYEQGLPKAAHPGSPLADSISLGIHESQSRMWENLVGRSAAFWQYFTPIAREHFSSLKDVKESDILFAVNEVSPGFIRVESDEVTYNLHILMRFELETQLLDGSLKISDVPAAWDARVKKYLGLTVPDAARGCLQDIHWSAGLVGYFPTYTLGNLYAAQFYEQARKDLGDLDAMYARGEFAPLLGWLRDRIHQHGSRYTATDLVKRVTGRPLDPAPLLKHLNERVEAFYG